MFTCSCAVCVTILSAGSKFHLVSNFMELHGLTQAPRSYALLYKANSSHVPRPMAFLQVTNDARAHWCFTDKTACTDGAESQVAGARAHLVCWCHLRGKMDQAIPHHFLHTESNQEWENPGNEAWVTLPKATNGLQLLTCRFYRMLRHNVIHVAARARLVSVAVRKIKPEQDEANTYVYLHTMTSSQNDMFIDNRGITSSQNNVCWKQRYSRCRWNRMQHFCKSFFHIQFLVCASIFSKTISSYWGCHGNKLAPEISGAR